MRPSRSTRALLALLADAGVETTIERTAPMGVGSAGLNARGNRDEDGTHARVALADGSSVIFREYAATQGMVELYRAKETAVFRLLADAGLPSPQVLASRGAGSDGEPPGTLLADAGGEPLEEVFRTVPLTDRPALWSAVGTAMRRLHGIPVDGADVLRHPVYERPWTRFVPYLLKSLRRVKEVRPDLAPSVDAMGRLRKPLQAYLDERPSAIGCTFAYLPGLLVVPAADGRWDCRSWLNLGYYVSIRDPAEDVAFIEVCHREWLGADVPATFHEAYGGERDPVCDLVYTAFHQLGRGAQYLAGRSRRPEWGPPPHSTAVRALDELPGTVEALADLLS